jgi:hypothetical protein
MTLNPREEHHFKNALYFTAVRGSNPRNRIKQEFALYHQALAWAQAHGDKRTMIYAVSADGSAHISNA